MAGTFGGAIFLPPKGNFQNAGKFNGSIWADLRLFDQPSGGPLKNEKERIFGLGDIY